MADKSRFGLELSEAEIDPSVFNKTIIILLKLAGYKMNITNSALHASLVIYHFISRTLS